MKFGYIIIRYGNEIFDDKISILMCGDAENNLFDSNKKRKKNERQKKCKQRHLLYIWDY